MKDVDNDEEFNESLKFIMQICTDDDVLKETKDVSITLIMVASVRSHSNLLHRLLNY